MITTANLHRAPLKGHASPISALHCLPAADGAMQGQLPHQQKPDSCTRAAQLLEKVFSEGLIKSRVKMQ